MDVRTIIVELDWRWLCPAPRADISKGQTRNTFFIRSDVGLRRCLVWRVRGTVNNAHALPVSRSDGGANALQPSVVAIDARVNQT